MPGIFSSATGSRNQRLMQSTQLTAVAQIAEVEELSHHPELLGVLLFKHSPRCIVSSFALRAFEKEWDFNSDQLPIFMVNVISERDISQQIATKFGVRHESPQILLIKNGVCVGNESHQSASVKNVKSWI